MKHHLIIYLSIVLGFQSEFVMAKTTASIESCTSLKKTAETSISKAFSDFTRGGELTKLIRDNLVRQTPNLYKEYSELKSCFDDLFFAANSKSELKLISKDRQWANDFGALAIFLEVLDDKAINELGAEEQHLKMLLNKLVPES